MSVTSFFMPYGRNFNLSFRLGTQTRACMHLSSLACIHIPVLIPRNLMYALEASAQKK